MSRLRLVCSALLLAVSGPVFADAASHAAQAERFLELTRADKLAVPVYAQVQQMFAQRFAQAQAPADKQALLESYQVKADAALNRAIGWDKLEPDMIKLYTSTFSESELQELMAFYQSPIGRKVLEKMPVLAAQSVQISQSRLQAAVPEVNRLLEEMSAELDKQKP
ncbi:DUF2059 domain-containing protein [Aquipseudomonas campi]|uniref:DUF2059 domain-containing protein n=1 Tax=Aquipseudomonas campi TaxID=2731681 RepID=A0A6M8FPH6_9GAMM|nr:DUF2059 domain-containing protein [Pseudomonas campi]QKE62668.1 DUF2059 domain-containing protein [Pseudomonas campi]